MVKVRAFICIMIIACLAPTIANAWNILPRLGASRSGTASMQFLKLGAGARAAALGNAVACASEDGFGLYWNPATLVWGEAHQVALSHNMWVVDVNYDFAGYSMKLNDDRAIGASVIYLGTPDMDVTDEYHPYGNGQKFGFADMAVGLSFSQRLTDFFSFGATVKYAQESLENLRMRGFMLDLGTYYQTNYRDTRFSVTLSNFGQQVRPGGAYNYINPSGETIPKSYQSFSPPTIFRIGMATDLMTSESNDWQAMLQLDHPTDNAESFSVGTEYGLNKTLFLRGGYKLSNDTQSYSVGLGLKFELFATKSNLDYAFAAVGDLGHSNTFSFQWSF
jgi:long-subunit fatty acid transport protein